MMKRGLDHPEGPRNLLEALYSLLKYCLVDESCSALDESSTSNSRSDVETAAAQIESMQLTMVMNKMLLTAHRFQETAIPSIQIATTVLCL